MRGVTEKACKAGVLLASALLLTGMQTRLGDLDTRLLETHNRERALAGVPGLNRNSRQRLRPSTISSL